QAVPPADEDGVQVLDPTNHTCPVCHTPLSLGRIEARDLLYCPACHGMLIPMDDIMALVEDLRSHRDRPTAYVAPLDGTLDAPALACPLCTHAMDHHVYGGGGNVMVDSCEDCSQVWLPRGALRKIASAPDRQPVYSNYGESSHFS